MPGLVAFYDIRPGKGAGIFSKEEMSNGEDNKEKVKKKDKRGSISKQTIYTVPKSQIKSRADYTTQPARGKWFGNKKVNKRSM